MHQNASLTLVQASKLPTYPKALQQFVEKYFDKMSIAGEIYFVAFGTLSYSPHQNNRKGVAPRHNLDLQDYKEGLPKGVELGDWITSQAKKEESGIVEYYKSWDDGCCGIVTDD
jgi:hypothetical protein